MTKVLGLFEVSQIFMVSDYCYQVFGSSKIVLPLLQGLDNGEEFPIINVIVSLGRREGGGVISAGMEISIGVLLHEYPSRGSKGGIHHDKEGFGGIWHLDYWGRQECFLKLDEGVTLFFSPVEDYPFLCQVMEWLGDCREVRNEFSIEVTESNEGSDHFDRFRWFPLFHGLKFGGVHEYFSISYHLLRMLDRHRRTPFFLLLGQAILTKRLTSSQ